MLVAADGRNSTVARLRNCCLAQGENGWPCKHTFRCHADFGDRVVLQFLPEGYSGQAPVGKGELNVCLVGEPHTIARLRRGRKGISESPRPHSGAQSPRSRAARYRQRQRSLFLVGDAARVVEPFTGEGIYYALRSGELAAQAIVNVIAGATKNEFDAEYNAQRHAHVSRPLWINRLARARSLSPRVASAFVRWRDSTGVASRLLKRTRLFVKPAGLHRVRHQHRNRHRSDAARHRSNRRRFFRNFLKSDIAHQPITAFASSESSTRLMPTSITTAPSRTCSALDKLWLANRRDQDVGRARDLGQIAAAGMDDRHGRVAALCLSASEEARAVCRQSCCGRERRHARRKSRFRFR